MEFPGIKAVEPRKETRISVLESRVHAQPSLSLSFPFVSLYNRSSWRCNCNVKSCNHKIKDHLLIKAHSNNKEKRQRIIKVLRNPRSLYFISIWKSNDNKSVTVYKMCTSLMILDLKEFMYRQCILLVCLYLYRIRLLEDVIIYASVHLSIINVIL